MTEKPLVIAVDGPAASGKGTLARRLAEHFGLVYLDTGKLYRYVAYRMLELGYDLEKDINKAIEIAGKIDLEHLLEYPLQIEKVGNAASIISSIPEVRVALINYQRKVASSQGGAALDGRDIGTVICPNAGFKFFITADINIRAKRRFKELQRAGKSVIYDEVLKDLEQRDARDKNRKVAPLKPAADAICIDTSQMEPDEVFKSVIAIIVNSDRVKGANTKL